MLDSASIFTLALVASFLLGSIPFGWITAKLWGVSDLRKVGSTNVGATNVVRAAGWKAGAITFLLDFAKGFAPLYYFRNYDLPDTTMWLGLAAVVGHCYSPFLSFRGGKGVSTALGVVVAFNPVLGAVSIFTYALVLAVTRTSALGSLTAMLVSLAGVLLYDSSLSNKLILLIIVIIVLVRHRANWETLLSSALAVALISSIGVSNAVAAAELKDFRNKTVDVAQRPKRIATLMPSLGEIVIDLDEGSRLVAVADYTRVPKVLSSKVQVLGPYNRLSAEAVYAAQPDLVIASMDGNENALVLQLEALGLRVLTVNTQSLAEIERTLDLVAAVIGQTAHPKIAAFKKALVPSKKASNSRSPQVFVQVGWKPLVTINKATFIHELVEASGGKSIFSDASMKYPRPNPEEVIAKDPDVILICKLTDKGNEDIESKEFWMRFKSMKAVRNGKIFVIPGDLITRPGFSMVEGLTKLRGLL